MSLSERECRLLDAELHRWLGTPYMPGSISRGRGVDCRYFVVGVLDALYRETAPIPARVPPDTGLHNRGAAFEILKQIAGRWPCDEHRSVSVVEPGDVIVIRSGGLLSPSHCLIVGVNAREYWHSTPASGVCRTGRATVQDRIVRVYRLKETDKW